MNTASKQTFLNNPKFAAACKNIDPEFQGWMIECPHCHNCKQQVVSKQTIARRYDATEVYTLRCGHTVI